MSDISAQWRFSGTAGLPLRAVTKTDLAYLQIRQKILEGDLAPGTSLDQETLAGALGLSTTPVREALRRLESERLVVSRVHRDTVVAPLSRETVEEVYAVRLSLDPLAAALAAAHASDGEREKILALSGEKPAKDDLVSHVYLNRRLHRSIYGSSGNTVLVDVLDSLWDLADRYRLIISRDTAVIKTAQEEHAAIIAAVVRGDADQASGLMHEHLAGSLERIRCAVAVDD
jgi:DNA-binding GntR family transcriptional regulator